ncbi:hypothetical protein GS461_09850 [Rhodococcus hoagii]|nr:hypothetical protein [Prescottella equi]
MATTPARDELKELLHRKGAYCGNCDYETGGCMDCDQVLGIYADAILAAGFIKAEREEIRHRMAGTNRLIGDAWQTVELARDAAEYVNREGLVGGPREVVRRLIGPWKVCE